MVPLAIGLMADIMVAVEDVMMNIMDGEVTVMMEILVRKLPELAVEQHT